MRTEQNIKTRRLVVTFTDLEVHSKIDSLYFSDLVFYKISNRQINRLVFKYTMNSKPTMKLSLHPTWLIPFISKSLHHSLCSQGDHSSNCTYSLCNVKSVQKTSDGLWGTLGTSVFKEYHGNFCFQFVRQTPHHYRSYC